jgi:hypothetical protein
MNAAAVLARLSSDVLHSVLGGLAVFCFWYGCQASDFNLVCYLFLSGVKYGSGAAVIACFKERYLGS